MLTPLVIAMPEKMATALGWPDEALGFADIVDLANDPEGWASMGHPEWGPFRLGKTNPNYSTSGLNFTVAEYYAAVGKSTGLSVEDLERPEAVEFATNVESSVVHYGDITMTFLNNWFATDARGTSLTYASAVAVEEKSVIDYNRGNPDGVLSPARRLGFRARSSSPIYPEEGTLFSDNPFIILDTEWVDDDEKAAAALFEEYVQTPENQAKVLEFGFRPNNPDVTLTDPISSRTGSIRPSPRPSSKYRRPTCWSRSSIPGRSCARKPACCWCSTSRARWATPADGRQHPPRPGQGGGGERAGRVQGCRRGGTVGVLHRPRRRRSESPRGGARRPDRPQPRAARRAHRGPDPDQRHPALRRAGKAYETMLDSYDPTKINAVVLLTDGVNDDGNLDDDRQQFTDLITQLQAGSEGAQSRPVRMFTISYGGEAAVNQLRSMAQATSAAHYDSSNPATIDKVFAAVISNF